MTIQVSTTGEDRQTDELCALAGDILHEIIQGNSGSHGGHAEWLARPPQYHLEAVIGHANSANRQLNLFKGLIDNEDAPAHMKRAIVRSVMAYYNYLALSQRKGVSHAG